MSLEMTVSSHFARALARVLGQIGWAEDAALKALAQTVQGEGLDQSAQTLGHSGRLPIAAFEAMFRTAEEALNDPLIGLKAGHVFRIANYGQTGAIYAFAQDLRDVIELNARYQKIAIDIGDIGYRVSGHAHIAYIRPYYGREERETYTHSMAVVMAAYGTAYQWLSWGSGQAIRRIDLPFPARDGALAWAEDQFRCPVIFDADEGGLVFSETAMKQPIPTADTEKRAIAVHKLEALLGGEIAQLHFIKAVREAIRNGLANGVMSATCLADRLGLSDSKLRTQMKQAGISYQSEVDSVRQSILKERFEDGASFAAISNDLGYNDQAAFNRAMRRWYGVAPGEWTLDMVPKSD